MTTTPTSDPVATMEIRRRVSALIVAQATAHAAVWESDEHDAGPTDVRVVVECVDSSGRVHHLSLDPGTAGQLIGLLDEAHSDAVRVVAELS